ncbi:MAG TPA: tripartite tricarboxylate transporter substrate binding protein [Burkholderiales bacterium]|nr:tripartite tricarboxylate transporter substrate binding protein [Burkholderiales bacterium]
MLPSGAVLAQAFPAKAVRLVLPFPPGGPTDLLGRTIAQKLSEQMGQQVVPENRPGAGGNLGLELAAKSPPDGYTMVLTSSVIALAPALYAKLNYKQSDLAPLSLVAEIRNILLVHPSVPAKNVKELVALARKNPGNLNYGSGGVGTTTHLTPELMMSITKTRMTHVPYKGSGLALIGLVGGHVDVLIMAAPAAAEQVKAGKARGLMIYSSERFPPLPNVPSAKEEGVEDYIVRLWYGILAPAGTPAPLIGRLNAEIVKAINSPDLRKRLVEGGVEPLTSTPEEFARFIAIETPRYAKIVKDANIPAQ